MKLKQYKTIQLVQEVLETYPETRDDSVELILRTWQMQGLELSDHQKGFIHLCIPMESISRAKRHLKHNGLAFSQTDEEKQGYVVVQKV